MSFQPQDRVKVSKTFSKILRHTADKYPTLKMDHSGFVSLESILCLPEFRKMRVDQEFVKTMVAEDSKSRFSLQQRGEDLFIRANQGHSHSVATKLSDSEIYESILSESDIPVAIHGTSMKAWESIKVSGLNRMGRSHIHFSPGIVGVDANVRSGMRTSSTIHIYLDVPKCMQKGIKFFRSDNDVILSEGIDGVISPDCFLRVIDRTTDTVLFPTTTTTIH
jgi:2'-phosphotransferase